MVYFGLHVIQKTGPRAEDWAGAQPGLTPLQN